MKLARQLGVICLLALSFQAIGALDKEWNDAVKEAGNQLPGENWNDYVDRIAGHLPIKPPPTAEIAPPREVKPKLFLRVPGATSYYILTSMSR